MEALFKGNEEWIESRIKENPAYFEDLAKGQEPQFLWIGCSDSRVPANEIVNMPPGSIFVQRNIANQVMNTDMNVLSVIYYAVKYLNVRHILVVGHYGCGGVNAAMSNQSFGFLDNWLVSIKNVYNQNRHELDGISDMEERSNRLVELNAIAQAKNIAKISFVQEAWQDGEYPKIHALVYSLKDGKLRDLNATIESTTLLRNVYQYKEF